MDVNEKAVIEAAWGIGAMRVPGAVVEPYELIELRVMVPASFGSTKQQRLTTLIHDHISEMQDAVCRQFDGARMEVH